MVKRVSQDAFGALFTRKKTPKKPRGAATDWCKRCQDGASYKKGHAPTCRLNRKKGDVTASETQRYCNQAYKFLAGYHDDLAAIESEPWYPNLVALAKRAKNVKSAGPPCNRCFNPTKKKTKDARDMWVPNAGETYYVCSICNAFVGWCRDVDFQVLAVVPTATPEIIHIDEDEEDSITDLTKETFGPRRAAVPQEPTTTATARAVIGTRMAGALGRAGAVAPRARDGSPPSRLVASGPLAGPPRGGAGSVIAGRHTDIEAYRQAGVARTGRARGRGGRARGRGSGPLRVAVGGRGVATARRRSRRGRRGSGGRVAGGSRGGIAIR